VSGNLSVTGGERLYAEVAGNGPSGTLASGGTGADGGGGASDGSAGRKGASAGTDSALGDGGGGSPGHLGSGGAGGSNLVPAGGTETTDTTGVPKIVVSFADTTPPALTLSSVPSPSTDTTPTLSGTGSTALGDEPTVTVNVHAAARRPGTRSRR
jgi:hypothetical protein